MAAVRGSVKGSPSPSREVLALLPSDDGRVPRGYVPMVLVDDGRVPRGYVPMVLVGSGEGDGEEQRIMVRVEMLGEPCMAAVLEMAAQQFGYGQRGVLRIPCGADRFQQMLGVACEAR